MANLPPVTVDADDWTITPTKANHINPRWPPHAEEWDADYRTDLDDGWKRQQDDPRPNIGVSCGGHYHDTEPGDGQNTRRYECVQCGLGKVLPYTTEAERKTQRKFACPACRQYVRHNPAGVSPRGLIPFPTND